MCGIVGYSGSQDAIAPVLEGLSRLEYRGYDSAGISFQTSDGLATLKKEGKLENLKGIVAKEKPSSHTAIGHTRWATHGKVNDTNAHPHQNEYFSIVHNGIIENTNKLKPFLIENGYSFQTETDSETFLNLLTYHYKKENDVRVAIIETFKMLEGNSAFVIMKKGEHSIWAIKRAAPLVCGINAKSREVYASSDPYALVGFAEDIYFPEDGVLCQCDYESKGEEISFFDLNNQPTTHYKMQQRKVELDVVSKGTFEHFMLKEIHEQPVLIKKLIEFYLEGEGRSALEAAGSKKFPYIHIAACGTALHAGMVLKNYFEKINSIRVNSDFGSEFRYKNPVLNSDEMGLFISQSGETADTLACQELCQENKLSTYSIVNVEGSTLFRNCDANLLIKAGIEIGVASTKAFTQQVLTGLLLSMSMAGKLDDQDLKTELSTLADRIDEVLLRTEEIKKIAQEIYQHKGFIFTGRGDQFPIALEGALKLKEIAYVHAEGYAAGELKHGPISLIDENMVNIAIVTPDLYDKTLSNAQEVKARRGIMMIVGEQGNTELEEISDYFFGLNLEGLNKTQPVLTNVVLQLLSYYIAKLKGTDIDKPRNLAKSVTVE
ncbi:MAG: glutamine--fructose-6-phosphate transaminase (isomerizing) [Bacteriovoracaceae bacterium]|nr:glutamine--fructose-6-phosphate transaminase (isomerizing) [Bacteriovoracaceae bacterium]